MATALLMRSVKRVPAWCPPSATATTTARPMRSVRMAVSACRMTRARRRTYRVRRAVRTVVKVVWWCAFGPPTISAGRREQAASPTRTMTASVRRKVTATTPTGPLATDLRMALTGANSPTQGETGRVVRRRCALMLTSRRYCPSQALMILPAERMIL